MINPRGKSCITIANFTSIILIMNILLSSSLTHSMIKTIEKIEEVVVTSRKYKERLIDIPISISVVNDETIKNSAIQNIHDLSYIVPGLSNNKSSGGTQRISIRGIGNHIGAAPLTGIYLDEIPASLPSSAIDLQTIDLQRIEVLKGPQGTLYGQGSVGGTIRFVSKSPSLEHYEGSVGLSAYSTNGGGQSEELTAIVNIPVINEKLAFRLATTYKDIAGWIDQPASNSDDVNKNKLDHIRIKSLWQATNKLSINATVLQHNNESSAGDIITTNETFGSDDQLVLLNADGSIPSTHRSHDYDLYNILLRYDLGFSEIISSSTKYNSIEKTSSESFITELSFAPGSEFSFINDGFFNETRGFAQEIRINGSDESWNWIIGIFFNDYDFENSIEGDQQFLDGIFLGGTSPAFFTLSSTSTALFGQISYDINKYFNIAIGTRYFEDEREMTGSVFPETRSGEFNKISSNMSISYTITENSNVYLNISEGFRSGGLNSFSDLTYKPESVIAYEVGVKSLLLNSKLRTEAAIYFNDYTDYQANVLNPNLGPAITKNPGEAEIKGFEISSQFKASPFLSLGFNGNVTEAEFTKINSNSNVFNVGDPISFIPKYSYSLFTDINFNWSSTITGFARIDYNRQGPSSETNRSGILLVPTSKSYAIGLLNAQIGAQLGEDITIKLFAKNINNEIRPSSPSLVNMHPQNRPRTLGVDFNYSF